MSANGDEELGGTRIVLTDTVPAGLTVRKILFFGAQEQKEGGEGGLGASDCTIVGSVVRCEISNEVVQPDQTLEMVVFVSVDPGAEFKEACPVGFFVASGCVTNSAEVEGGGAPAVRSAEPSTTPNTVNGSSAPPFGPAGFDFFIGGSDGLADTQAGGHPYELTTTINLNSDIRDSPFFGRPESTSVQDPKDIVVDLPLGFVASTLSAPECTFAQLPRGVGGCPPDTVVGHLLTAPYTEAAINSPIWNMVPEHGFPAEFAVQDDAGGNPHLFYARVVPSAAGYVLQVTNPDIPTINLTHIVAQFYGDPSLRAGTGGELPPYFTNPTGCQNGPMVATVYMDSWQNRARFNPDGTPVNLEEPAWVKMTSTSPPVTGCDGLSFTPELFSKPTTEAADTPSGMNLELKVPQNESFETVATPALKNATITFPEGFTIDPSAGDGLGACSEAQIGWLGGTPKNFNAAPPECPESSKVGTLELTTPLLPQILHGEMYLADQNENPYGTEIGLYVVVQDPITGVLIKLAGKTLANPQTGQITGVFEENPQLPFSELKLEFFGGPRAEFATSDNCGMFTTTSDLSPWSSPESGPSGKPFYSFPIDTGCVSGFNPAFTGSNLNLQAGAYSPFVASFSREDTDQELGGLSVNLPPGLLADVGSVPECGEAQANAGSCPESTQVGTTLAEAGPGPNPLPANGKVYLTGPYNGGPYGLSVVVPAVAGPFNFGLVIVRQSLRINPATAAVTDVSDQFPTMLDAKGVNGETIGIPIRLRRVEVSIDGAGSDLNHFTFNPTNCSKLQVGGAITSTQGASSSLATPFQVTNCASLKFAPKVVASTSGKTSRASGASLSVKITNPATPQGTQADIAKFKVDLPKQLPSRLTTLQKACTAAQFNANPAGCPSASVVGHMKVQTPILNVPVEGPMYFVSHGGEAFPELEIVLQGAGVKIILTGDTYISKAGVTSSTFNAIPDTPFTSAEVTLGEGKYSALAANGNLCKTKLAMPTALVGQNGAEIKQNTHIEVEGCPNTISISSHKVKGKTTTLSVYVPAAGKLTATGKGLSSVTKTYSGQEAQTFTLTQKKGGKLKTKIKLTFTPSKGKKQSKTITISFKK